ncbi:splicing factor, Prp19-binding domain-containing protein [Mucidula mucida]|nr:splicing factor, Prp19-binding domain-containing protein [Mucidula mucida]
MSTSRKPAPRLARPAARYWKGKAPKGVAEVDSDSDAEDEAEDIVDEADEDDLPTAPAAPKPAAKAINFALKDMDISRETQVKRDAAKRLEGVSEDEEEEEADVQDESSEEETSSEEEEPAKPQFRPVFVPKRSRVTIAEKEALAEDTEEAIKRREAEAEERRRQSHDLVAESIRRELAESESDSNSQRILIISEEKEEEIPDVDDTDGVDPEAEFEAWRLRELGRIKKEKEEEVRREQEREEIERRRALPEAQRMKEDLEHASKLRDEKPKGQQKFLQKYWHKGAFHQDADILKRHDFTEATESTMDVSMLPKVMQVKNFGKRSRTKYTHLLDQDTTVAAGGFGGTAPVKSGGMSLDGGGCFLCGGPHLKKDCPQNTGPLTARSGVPGSGANNVAAGGSRQWGGPPKDTNRSWRSDGRADEGSWKARDDRTRHRYGDDRPEDYRDERRGNSRRRSRSPDPRDRDYRSSRRRSRSRSPSRERPDTLDRRDKRRRVDT